MKVTLEISKEDLVQLLVAMRENTQVNINLQEMESDVVKEQRLQKLLDTPISEFEGELSVRAMNALYKLKVIELVSKNELDLLKMRNIGRQTHQEIAEWVKSKGLHFGYKKGE